MKRLLVAVPLMACQGSPERQAAPAASGSAAARPAVSASAAPATAWYEGAFQGSYRAELRRIELAAGGVRDWKKDDGARASGDGKLVLQVQADGSVSGKASGPLGEQDVSGRIEGERIALRLTPTDANGFQGVLFAAQSAAGITGWLSASTGDSLLVRRASVTLSKVGK